MKKFEVEVCRTYYAFGRIEVEANTEKQAKKIALECIEDFSIKDTGEDEIISIEEITEEE